MGSVKARLLKAVVAGLLGVCATGVLVYNFFPQTALRGLSRSYELRAGLAEHSTTISGYRIPYYRGGRGPKLVLLHGFGDSKLSFVQAARLLTPHFTVILPDLPGFGATVRQESRNHSIRSQVEMLRGFLEAIGLTRGSFHLGGNSMGGHISAAYVLRYPAGVRRLILIDAAGLRVDDPLPYKPMTAPARNLAEFRQSLRKNFVKIPWVPGPFAKVFIARSQRDFFFHNRIRTQIRGGPDYVLNQRIHEIKIPTLIIWGDGDRTVRPVHAGVWQKKLTRSRLVMMKQMGHAPQYERPAETARLILRFLRE